MLITVKNATLICVWKIQTNWKKIGKIFLVVCERKFLSKMSSAKLNGKIRKKYKTKIFWSEKTESLLCDIWAEKIYELRGARKNKHIYDEMCAFLSSQNIHCTNDEIKKKCIIWLLNTGLLHIYFSIIFDFILILVPNCENFVLFQDRKIKNWTQWRCPFQLVIVSKITSDTKRVKNK